MADAAVVGVIGTIAGVVLGGTASFIADAFRIRREHRRSDRELLRGKLEELCEAAELVAQAYRNTRGFVENYFNGKRDALPDETPVPWARLQMLVHFYAPELRPSFDRLIKQREPFAESMTRALVTADARDADSREARNEFQTSTVELLRLATELQAETAASFHKRFPNRT